MIIKNAEVYTEEGKFEKRDIFIKDDKFVATAEEAFSDTANSQTIDGTGCYAIPGYGSRLLLSVADPSGGGSPRW